MKKRLHFLVFFTFFAFSSVHAGAWVQKKGSFLNILGIQRYISDQYWTSGGRLLSSPTYAKNFASNYTEYGLTDYLTVGLYFSALESRTAARGTQGGLNDMMLWGRYLLWSHGPAVLSAQFFADKLGIAAQFNVPPQNGSFNSGEALLIGTSGQFKTATPQFWFADASFGLIQRYSAGNQMQINVEAGYKFHEEKAWLLLQEYNTLDMDHLQTPRGSNYTLVTIAPSALYWVSKGVGFQLGMTQDFFGQNVGKGRSFFVSNWLRFDS